MVKQTSYGIVHKYGKTNSMVIDEGKSNDVRQLLAMGEDPRQMRSTIGGAQQ